ncbi:hypothetical protein [Algoriphagus limi]|uniref:Uncharacterized protein n=1 Tax=Algoriphagus limi TaxID=2975273 RepID=A0ABT2G7X8_9BACT|nr:hypothetical protein [Algoriphagus limi]MCS5491373.1 hypothetical protein [Algoriphagus limi]
MKETQILDPGQKLGKVVVKLAQLLFATFSVLLFLIAYLGNRGLFQDWNIKIEPEFSWFLSSYEPHQIVTLFCVVAGFKFLILLGIMVWIDRDI